MTEESSNVNQGVPTGIGFDTGPDTETMSPEAAAQEYNGMMRDPKFMGSEYEDNITHASRVERSQKLFKRGFAEKLAKQKETREEEGRKFLEREGERIAEREDLTALAKARQEIHFYFGGEKAGDAVIQTAQEVLGKIGTEEDIEFLANSGLGNNPRIIEMLGNLKNSPELYPAIKNIGIKNLIQIGNIALRRHKK